MNAKILLMIALLASDSVLAEVPEGQTVGTMPWNQASNGGAAGITCPLGVKTDIEEPSDRTNLLAFPLKITYVGAKELQLKLLPTSFDSQRFQESIARVVTHHFSIIGEVRYENVSAGSYLEMWSHFASPAPGYPEGAYFSRTLADSGPMGRLDGTSDWREFTLPFDATGVTSKLMRLEMNLHLTGPGTVHLRNMRLVQYPDPAPVNVPVLPKEPDRSELVVQLSSNSENGTIYTVDGTTYPNFEAFVQALRAFQKEAGRSINHAQGRVVIRADQSVNNNDVVLVSDAVKYGGLQLVKLETTVALKSHDIDWKSFLLGVAATGVFLLAGGGFLFILRRWNRRHHERELRRIASLDS